MTAPAIVTREAEERRRGPVSALMWDLGRVNHLVLHRARLQSMPLDWQRDFTGLLDELRAAYAGQPETDFVVTAAEYLELCELTPEQLAQARITVTWPADEDPDGVPRYTGPDGTVLDGSDTVPVPVADPVPYYRHAWLPPDEEAIAGVRARRGRTAPAGERS